MDTLKAYKWALKNIVEPAMKQKGWGRSSLEWCETAHVGEATLRVRFLGGKAITANCFISICEALGVNWEEVAKPVDRGEAPAVPVFYGREEELTQLSQWLVQDRCKCVVLRGMGGIGKTFLTVKLVDRVLNQYQYIIWRSLRNAPPLQELLADVIEFLADEERSDVNVSQLIEYLRRQKCLIVLDDVETIMEIGELAGKFREGYKDYGSLLKQVGENHHQSCLLLLSRQKPVEIDLGDEQFVRSFKLRGLHSQDAKKFLNSQGISGCSSELEELNHRYKGNPSALKIVAQTIQELFQGNIAQFISATTVFLPDPILGILEQQFTPLSDVEKDILYWLVVRRSGASFMQIQEDIMPKFSGNEIINALISLERRSLVENTMGNFILEPVILKYLTKEFVEIIHKEIINVVNSQNIEEFELFISHALIPSQDEDESKRRNLVRLIVKPIKEKLCAEFRSRNNAKEKLSKILSLLQEGSLPKRYAEDNFMTLLAELQQV